MLQSRSTLWQGYGVALLAIVLISAATILAKLGLNLSGLNFYSVAIWGWISGMLIATVCFYIPVKSQRQSLWTEIKTHSKFFAVISILAIISGNSWFYSLSQINGGVFGLIEQNTLLWSFILGVVFLGEKFSFTQILSVGVTLLGFGLISSLEGETTLIGIISLTVFGGCLALQSLIIKKYTQIFSPFALNFCRGWSMALGSLIILLTLGKLEYNIEPLVLGIMCLSQVCGIFLGRVAFIKTHEYLPISQINFLMIGMSVLVLFGSWLWLDEPLGFKKLIGAFIIIAGLGWFIIQKPVIKSHA